MEILEFGSGGGLPGIINRDKDCPKPNQAATQK
jgi:hypothetical protein